jgi:small subunit ribosomal protein S6
MPGTSREYETTYILRPNTTNEGVAEVNTRIKGIIEGMGGKVIKVDNWGKRRLAYEVAKERKGIYLYWQYLAQPGVVEETERNLRMLDSVIRYLTVKIDEDVDTGARPSEIDEQSYEKAAQTAADEEDLFLSRGGDDLSSGDDDLDLYGADDDGDIIPGSKKPVVEAEAAAAAAPAAAADTEEKE